jgi:uncharacterized membrane protein YfcA
MSPWWAVVLVGVFLIGVTKSGFGSGVGLMIVPMMTIAATHIPALGGAKGALPLMLPLLILGDLIAVWQYRRLFSLEIVKHLLPGTLLGVILGGLLLWWFERQAEHVTSALIRTEIGLECVVLVGLHWWRVWRGDGEAVYVPKPIHSHLTGAFAAVSSTLAHAAGPIIALYLLPQRLDRQLFVGTCAIYFFLLNTAKLPAYSLGGLFAKVSPVETMRYVPLLVAGALFGFWVNRRMNDRLFSRVVYAVTFVLGVYVLADGVATLWSLWRQPNPPAAA